MLMTRLALLRFVDIYWYFHAQVNEVAIDLIAQEQRGGRNPTSSTYSSVVLESCCDNVKVGIT